MCRTFLMLTAMFVVSSWAHAQASSAPRAEEISYGSHQLQRLDYWRGRDDGAPVVLFVHGGGWQDGDKEWIGEATAAHYVNNGFAYGSINYRLVPEATVEQQVQDVADAAAYLLKRADQFGARPQQVMLIGHSSGGHLVALIATDPRYLNQAGLQPAVIRGVVLLEGAGLAPRPLNVGEARKPHPVFGLPERQLALSPLSHTEKSNTHDFLMLVAGNAELRRQATVFGDSLRANGTAASLVDIPESDHNLLVSNLGLPGDRATAVIDEFARKAFAVTAP